MSVNLFYSKVTCDHCGTSLTVSNKIARTDHEVRRRAQVYGFRYRRYLIDTSIGPRPRFNDLCGECDKRRAEPGFYNSKTVL